MVLEVTTKLLLTMSHMFSLQTTQYQNVLPDCSPHSLAGCPPPASGKNGTLVATEYLVHSLALIVSI